MIFSQDDRKIFEMHPGFNRIFDAFETLIEGSRLELEHLNDRNINVLLLAMEAHGNERSCILLQHSLALLADLTRRTKGATRVTP